MNKYIAKELLERYLQGDCTEEEKAIVESWHLNELEIKKFQLQSSQIEPAYEKIWIKISKEAFAKKKAPLKSTFYRYASAAIVFITVATGLFLFVNRKSGHPTVNDLLVKTGKDFVPGGNKAILTLSDGSVISLTDAVNGNLAKQAGITISKAKDGQIIYSTKESTLINETNGPSLINTISTPRGGQYQINLPDGTRVWLNSQSSLKYPIHFNGNKREVELSGEGYFEVHKNHIPFIVKTKMQEVKVLGTHFNINSYEDETTINTTLLEGSVSVLVKNKMDNLQTEGVILKPGQASVVGNNRPPKIVKADIESIMAWKNNLFFFKDESLESISRQLSRWYDVDVSFQGKPLSLSFVGMVSRSKNISSVLKILESAGNLHFKIEGKKIIILN